MNETDIILIPGNTPSLQRNSRPQSTIERGEIPPQDLNLEEVILGAILIDKEGVDDAIGILNSEVFYEKQHQPIYQAIFELFNQSEAINLLTVAEWLRRMGNLEVTGGEFYLISLT